PLPTQAGLRTVLDRSVDRMDRLPRAIEGADKNGDYHHSLVDHLGDYLRRVLDEASNSPRFETSALLGALAAIPSTPKANEALFDSKPARPPYPYGTSSL